jgi:hypothetical protein
MIDNISAVASGNQIKFRKEINPIANFLMVLQKIVGLMVILCSVYFVVANHPVEDNDFITLEVDQHHRPHSLPLPKWTIFIEAKHFVLAALMQHRAVLNLQQIKVHTFFISGEEKCI